MKKIIVNYMNTRTNEMFVSAEAAVSVKADGSEKEVRILKREDGSRKEVAESTFKRYYKMIETEVEDPKTETKLNRNQIAALKNIKGAYNDYIGGLENDVQDGNREEMPPLDELFEGVYAEATSTSFKMMGGLSVVGGPAPVCMRFAGKKFIREQIAELFRKDGYDVPEELVEVPEKKQGHSNVVDGERINLRNDEGEQLVNVRAFTGMLIGTFKVEKETATTITVKAARGKLVFDKKTGLQTNANNKRFANRIDI